MKRIAASVLLLIAAIPIAFFLRAWLTIHGLDPTEAFAHLQLICLAVQLCAFFLGCILQVW